MKQLFTISPDVVGRGKVLFKWNNRGTHLAVAGSKRKVCIFDRTGTLLEEVALAPPEGAVFEGASSCVALEWDTSGENLAILPTQSNIVLLWSRGEGRTTKLDTGMKDLSFMAWCRSEPTLAVGTAKGNLLIFNEKIGKRIPLMGKHTRRIACGTWTPDNKLILGADDKVISTSRLDGEHILGVAVRGEPLQVAFSQRKEAGADGARRLETTISANVNKKVIYLYRAGALEGAKPDDAAAVELTFQEKYGAIVSHEWFGDGYMLVGFAAGNVVVMSTHKTEVAEEVFSAHALRSGLSDIALNGSATRVAVCGSNLLRLMEMRNFKAVDMPGEEMTFPAGTMLDHLGWTPDGQVVAVSTTAGEVHAFLAALPLISAAYDDSLAYLTSLQEISVVNVVANSAPTPVEVETEPSFLALGALHVAAGMNNMSYVYRLRSDGPGPPLRVNQKQYLGAVDRMALNDRMAVALGEGRLQVHVLERETDPSEKFDVSIPDKGACDVTCMGLTAQFLIYGTKRGSVVYYYLGSAVSLKQAMKDRGQISEYRHSHPIRALWPNRQGTRVVFLDDRGMVFFLNPVTDVALHVEDFAGHLSGCVFDLDDTNVFVLSDETELLTYVHHPNTISGPTVACVGSTPRPAGTTAAALCKGTVTLLNPSGMLQVMLLMSHSALQGPVTGPPMGTMPGGAADFQKLRFDQALQLGHLPEAWAAAFALNTAAAWNALAEKALEYLDLALAIRVYRLTRNPSMVLSLERIASEEDRALLAGHITVLLGRDFDAAQEHFLRSRRPQAALEMRCDLRQWPAALALAPKLAPRQIPQISRDFALQLEMRGDYDAALMHYEQGLTRIDGSQDPACFAGIARMRLQTGDFRRGRDMAMAANSAPLYKECAGVLESMNELAKAAELYEKAGAYEKAAGIYILSKAFQQAAPLMNKIQSPKLHLQFAKAMEAEGRLEAAVAAYEAAGETEAVVRLYLEPLKNPLKAYAIARKSRSVDAANLIAKYCKMKADFKGAVEFLILGKRSQEAFDLAQAHGEVDTYLATLGETSIPEEYLRLAKYYESKGEYVKAAGLYERCSRMATPPGQLDSQALKLYIRAGVGAMEPAIQLVGAAQNPKLTSMLVDFLIGQSDGIPKDHNFLFSLQMATKDFGKAAKTAGVIARQEQSLGNYKVAHSQLVETLRALAREGGRWPGDLTRQLLLLHSYILVKTRVKLQDHLGAAWLLVRVSRHISKFPAHVVPILTSTVIECQRAELKRTAHEYATMLMRPEYRPQIAEAYKRKIENIVRKPDFKSAVKSVMMANMVAGAFASTLADRGAGASAREAVEAASDDSQGTSACPFCKTEGPSYDLECTSCSNLVPYCIATGKRMALHDWACCPSCKFPAMGSELRMVLELEGVCPMCGDQVAPAAVVRVEDPLARLQKETRATTDEDGGAGADGGVSASREGALGLGG